MHVSPLTRRRFLTVAGAAAGSLLTQRNTLACGTPQIASEHPIPTGGINELARAINSFATDLYAQFVKDDKNTLFFSPFSVSTALAMVSAGAKGKTLSEMQNTLHLPNDPNARFHALLNRLSGNRCGVPGFELTTANALWAMKGFPWRKEFFDLTRENYGAGLVETDFNAPEEARQQINTWVEKETREKIKNLIPEGAIDIYTRLVLTNAVYFKGTWASKFDEKLTKNVPFTCIDGSKSTVPLMTQSGEFEYGELSATIDNKAQKMQVLTIPYAGKELSMRVYLPADSKSLDRLPEWIARGGLGEEKLKPRQVHLHLPRFKAESEFSLEAVLRKLGMNAVFDDADLTGMHTGKERLFLSAVVHKAYVDVNEQGTEAAAATGAIVKTDSLPSVTTFRADHPFLFTIRDNMTGTILFMGRYTGPN